MPTVLQFVAYSICSSLSPHQIEKSPYKNSKKLYKNIIFLFLFTISQSILFKAISGAFVSVNRSMKMYLPYIYSIFCCYFSVYGFVTKSKAISLCRLIVKN